MEKLYYNGDIITMRKENDAPEAVLVSKGRIAFVGDLKEAKQRCTAETELVDLQGKTLMPSFIDAHGHITMHGFSAAGRNASGISERKGYPGRRYDSLWL